MHVILEKYKEALKLAAYFRKPKQRVSIASARTIKQLATE